MTARAARLPGPLSLPTALSSRAPPPLHRLRPQTRAFLTAPLQRITARRTLPHPPTPIYLVIAAVPAYAAFLPYCLASRVTRWSPRPDALYGLRWPDEAELEVGWGAVREAFTSRIYCAPGRRVVEAVGGGARTTLGGGGRGAPRAARGRRRGRRGGGGGGGAAGGVDAPVDEVDGDADCGWG